MSDATTFNDNEDEVTPSLEQLLIMAVKDQLFDVCISGPGVVVSFDPTTGTASIQPALQRKFADGTLTNLPVLNDVPIMYPSSGKAQITFPLFAGDPVWLVFSHRSIEVWKAQGGVVNPADPRRFHLSDAVAYPGTNSPSAPLTSISSNSLRMSYGQSRFDIQDGKMLFTGMGGELLDTLISITAQLSTIANFLSTTTTNTQLGPQTLLNAPDFAKAKSAIDTLKATLTGLKGS